jgi:hypothetical protein
VVQFKSGAYSSAGYEVYLTSMSDLVTNAPSPVTLSLARSGNNFMLNWTAVPYSYSYSVYASANVAGPYAPLATGLTFTNTLGAYPIPNANNSQTFYRIVSP